jgi:hypothetical protein
MPHASLDRRIERLQRQVELLRALQRAELPDAVALMEQSGLTPDSWQYEVLTSDAPRTMLNCSRQSGKSTVAAAIALAEALRQGSLVLLLSPSLRQSTELFTKVLRLYRHVDHTVPPEQQSALQLRLANGGRIVSLPGKEGQIRGFSSVGLLIIDEAARVLDELYLSVRPMISVSRGRIVLLSTPFGKRGFFYREWAEGDGWYKVEIPADRCPRIDREFLQEEYRTLGDLWYAQEYQCRFVDAVNQVFTFEAVMAALSNEVQPLFASAEM